MLCMFGKTGWWGASNPKPLDRQADRQTSTQANGKQRTTRQTQGHTKNHTEPTQIKNNNKAHAMLQSNVVGSPPKKVQNLELEAPTELRKSLYIWCRADRVILGAFWFPFWPYLGSRGSLGRPMEPPRAVLGPLFEHLFFMSFFSGFWVPPRVPENWIGGMTPCALVRW